MRRPVHRHRAASSRGDIPVPFFMIRPLTFLAVATALAGCATAPVQPLAASHPASAEAAEGARIARTTSLRPDAATRKTRALLSSAKRQQEQWDAYGPVSGTPEDAPKTEGKMDMPHEH